jgi:hypothetical protein
VLREPEREGRRAVLLVVLHTLAAFGYRRNVTDGDPPEAVNGLIQLDEPLAAITKDANVVGAIDVIAQRFERIPHGHVDEHGGVIVVDDVRGVAGGGLQAPDEAGGAIGDGVNRFELVDEFGDPGIIDGSNQAAYVDLGEMVSGHEFWVLPLVGSESTPVG